MKIKIELKKNNKRLNEIKISISHDKTNFELIGCVYTKVVINKRIKKMFKEMEERISFYFNAQQLFMDTGILVGIEEFKMAK